MEPLTPGVIDDWLVFTPIDGQGRRLPETELHITGEFVPDISCEPREVRFGRIRVGSVVEETITVRSLTGRPCTVKAVTASSPELSAQPAGQRGDRWLYRVSYRVTGVGERPAELRIEATDDGGLVGTTVVPLRVTGVDE